MASTTTRRPAKPKAPEKEELLTTEHHPITGTLERWRMSDGTVWRFGPEGGEPE